MLYRPFLWSMGSLYPSCQWLLLLRFIIPTITFFWGKQCRVVHMSWVRKHHKTYKIESSKSVLCMYLIQAPQQYNCNNWGHWGTNWPLKVTSVKLLTYCFSMFAVVKWCFWNLWVLSKLYTMWSTLCGYWK